VIIESAMAQNCCSASMPEASTWYCDRFCPGKLYDPNMKVLRESTSTRLAASSHCPAWTLR
jgi:hypothetical protein